MATHKLAPLHPGEVLTQEFMAPLRLTAYGLAKACQLPRTRIERIAAEKVGITANTAFHLAKYFGTTPEFWMNLQKRYEIERARPTAVKELVSVEPRQAA